MGTPLTPHRSVALPLHPSNARLQHSETQVSITLPTNRVKYDLAVTLRTLEGRGPHRNSASFLLFWPSTYTPRHLESPFKKLGQLPTCTPLLVTSAQATAAQLVPMTHLSSCSQGLQMPARAPLGRPCRKVSWSEVPFSRLFSSQTSVVVDRRDSEKAS